MNSYWYKITLVDVRYIWDIQSKVHNELHASLKQQANKALEFGGGGGGGRIMAYKRCLRYVRKGFPLP